MSSSNKKNGRNNTATDIYTYSVAGEDFNGTKKFKKFDHQQAARCLRIWTIVGWIVGFFLLTATMIFTILIVAYLYSFDIEGDLEHLKDALYDIEVTLTHIMQMLGGCGCPIP